MAAAFLEVDRISKSFGGLKAVGDVSFKMSRDEIIGLIGPNGAGKTTLLRLITGLLKPDSGMIAFKGIANVMVPCLSPRAMKRGEWVKRIEAKSMDALEFAGISDMALEKASTLSQGDLKRLEVARAIATEPELLLLDEPFGGLSPAETELMAKSIKRLHKGGRFGRLHSEGPAMVIIEHKLQQLMKIVDRVIVLNFGTMVADGPPEQVVANKEVIECYLGKGGI
jgi:branched-chain amino acid transport system ATP-binding protein